MVETGVRGMRQLGVAGMLVLAGYGAALAQAAKQAEPVKKVLSGCVTASVAVPGTLVLRSAESCTELAGALARKSLAGHEASLEGMLTEATAEMPETLRIVLVKHVGETCQETCTPEPPGRRGLRKKEVPAGNASTPGVQAPEPKPE